MIIYLTIFEILKGIFNNYGRNKRTNMMDLRYNFLHSPRDLLALVVDTHSDYKSLKKNRLLSLEDV